VKIEAQTALSRNITLVYDLLDLQTINTSDLKELVDSQTRPVVMDTPEMIVAVYQSELTIIQIADQHIRITSQKQSQDIGDVPLWEIAFKCNQLVPESKSALFAYGFNYDVGAVLADGNAHTTIIASFISDLPKIENVLEGHLSSFTPRLTFQKDQKRYNLILEVVEEQQIKAHLNAHFEFKDITLPPLDQLKASFYEEYDYLISLLPKLFE
jgi:hypothetical protein